MNFVTTKDFVNMIFKSAPFSQDLVKDNFEAAKELGIIDAQDVLNGENALERRHAAKIMHTVLRKLCKEKDEADINKASVLADLYDCRVCANNVAQMFLKGIMDSRITMESGRLLFCPKDEISYEEAENMIFRLFNKELRLAR